MASMRQTLKPLLRAAGNRLRFPRARLGPATYLSAGTTLGRDVSAGRDCRLFAASLGIEVHLGDRVSVGHGTRLVQSTLGDDCAVEQAAELYGCTLADHVAVQTRSVLTAVRIGRCSLVAREAHLNDVAVGAFCSIGPRTLLGCGDHPVNLTSTAPVFYSTRAQCGLAYAATEHFVERRPIGLGHDVWLGAQVFVRDGVTIGDGAIVAAGAVVTADVPPYAIVGGVPAKLIRFRYPADIIGRLQALRWWDWPEPRLRAAQPWFVQPDIAAFLRHATA